MLPDFLIIGAQKAGTTAIAQYLYQHPQIGLVDHEVHFFGFLTHGYSYYTPRNSIQHAPMTLAQYEQLFARFAGKAAVGEKSPSYLNEASAPDAIRQHVPDAKLIAILRQPADRAFSAFLHAVRVGHEPETDFARALALEATRIAQHWDPVFHYRHGGLYGAQLERYYARFPREQIAVYLYDDFRANPQRLLRDVFGYLGVDATFAPDMRRRHNVSGLPRNRVSGAVYRLTRFAGPVVKRLVPPGVKNRLHGVLLSRPALDPATRAALTASYREDILKLQDLIGRDLSHWLA